MPFDPVTAHGALIDRAVGYFKQAGGNGGQGGTVVFVDSMADMGTGTIRDFMTQTGPRIILFEDGLSGTVNVASDIVVKSDKTLWGRHRDGTAADITIAAADNVFVVEGGVTNVIISNVKGIATGAGGDWVSMGDNGSGIVWVDHVSYSDLSIINDAFVDCTVGARDLTVSFCTIETANKAHLWRLSTGSNGARSTLHHCFYRNVLQRSPKTDEPTSQSHVFNVWLETWGSPAGGGNAIRGTLGGENVVENCIFTAGAKKAVIEGDWNGSGNVFENGATASSTTPVFTVPYSYTLDPTSTAAEIQALKDKLSADAGWQTTFDDGAPPVFPPVGSAPGVVGGALIIG